MATQSSIINLRGKVGNIVFSKRNGKFIAAMAPGSNKSKFRDSDSFVRVRENANEFKGLRMLAHSLNRLTAAIEPSAKSKADITPRLMRLLARLRYLDTASPRGRRAFALSGSPSLVAGFEWNSHVPLLSVVNAQFVVTRSAESVSFRVPAITPENIAAPSGATHYRLIFLVGSVSDVTFSNDDNAYGHANAEADCQYAFSLGELTDVTANGAASSVSVSNPVSELNDATLIAAVGAIFYQQVGTQLYVLKDTNALQNIAAWDGGSV